VCLVPELCLSDMLVLLVLLVLLLVLLVLLVQCC
jgi:hypothetical protein